MNLVSVPIDLKDFMNIPMDPYRPWWNTDWSIVRAVPCASVYAFVHGTKPEDGVLPCFIEGTFDIGQTTNNQIWDHKGIKKSGSPVVTKKTSLESRFKKHRDPIVAGYKHSTTKKEFQRYRLHNRICEHWEKYVSPDFGYDTLTGKTWWTVLRAPEHISPEETVAWLRTVEQALTLYYIRRFKRPPALAFDHFTDFRKKNGQLSLSDQQKIVFENGSIPDELLI